MTHAMNTGANIWFTMKEKGMDFDDVVQALKEHGINDIDGSGIRLVINGRMFLTYHDLQILADILETSVSKLLEEGNNATYRFLFGEELGNSLTDREKQLIDGLLSYLDFVDLHTRIYDETLRENEKKRNNNGTK